MGVLNIAVVSLDASLGVSLEAIVLDLYFILNLLTIRQPKTNKMVLYMIGLGLGEPTDITVKGLQAVKSSDHVYLEIYTSILPSTKEQLEEIYEKPVIEADRMMVESECEEMLNRAISQNVSFLVVGDVFGATTHHDLYLRAI